MILRHHPSGVELGAWFDDEGAERIGVHVTRCRRCQRRVSDIARVRAWVRASPFVAMGEPSASSPPPRARRKVVAVAVAVLVVFALVLPEEHDRAFPPRGASTEVAGGGGQGAETAAGEPSVVLEGGQLGGVDGLGPDPIGGSGGAATPPDVGRDPGRVPVGGSRFRAGRPLRLGLIVPTSGFAAMEGEEVRTVVSRPIAAANAAGGVGGFPVELVVVAAEDRAAVASLPRRVDALVGGFGLGAAPVGVPWLLPADPTIAGPEVLAAEASPRTAGVQLATLLEREGIDGPVGVVLGSAPDAALAAGLASKVVIATVPAARTGNCDGEVASLQSAGAVALAVAAEPEVAARCLQAAARAAWRPRFGVLVPPSAAYARLDVLPYAAGARTVLGLPWPTSPVPGTARFRAGTHSLSYRALVSFAAAELAIDVARRHGALSMASITAGTWRTDLVDLVGTTNRSQSVVAAAPQAWLPAG